MKLIAVAATLLLASSALAAAIDPEADIESELESNLDERGLLQKIIDSVDTDLYGPVHVLDDVLEIRRAQNGHVMPVAQAAPDALDDRSGLAASLPDPSDPWLYHNTLMGRSGALASSEEVCANNKRPDVCKPGFCCPPNKHACCYDKYGSCIPNKTDWACCKNTFGACRPNQICCTTGVGCCPRGWTCAPQNSCTKSRPQSGKGGS